MADLLISKNALKNIKRRKENKMDRFLQLHILTAYPPSNLNRDDLGRPKTAIMGGFPRLRVSSQSLKRAWRTSDVFENRLKENIGTRTKKMGTRIYDAFEKKGIKHKNAFEWARTIASVFGKPKSLSKKEKDELKDLSQEDRIKKEKVELEIEQLAHFSPEEENGIWTLIDKVVARGEGPGEDDLKLLRSKMNAADISLFGRMLAGNPKYNIEAACQVAHAVTVHKAVVEDDFFTAVDDLNIGEEDVGAGHMGETEFGSGLFYLYLCIDRELLLYNLNGEKSLTEKTISALVESAATVSPTGKQNSFASRARASYILCETGPQQPRTLSVAFFEPVFGQKMLNSAIEQLKNTQSKMNDVYGKCSEKQYEMNAYTGKGSLNDIIKCAVG